MRALRLPSRQPVFFSSPHFMCPEHVTRRWGGATSWQSCPHSLSFLVTPSVLTPPMTFNLRSLCVCVCVHTNLCKSNGTDMSLLHIMRKLAKMPRSQGLISKANPMTVLSPGLGGQNALSSSGLCPLCSLGQSLLLLGLQFSSYPMRCWMLKCLSHSSACTWSKLPTN